MLNEDDVADDLQNAILGQGGLVAWLQSARFTVIVMLQTTRPSLPQMKEKAWYKNIFSHKKNVAKRGVADTNLDLQKHSKHPIIIQSFKLPAAPGADSQPAKRCSLPSVAARHSWNHRSRQPNPSKTWRHLACYKE